MSFEREIALLEDLARWAEVDAPAVAAKGLGGVAREDFEGGRSPAGAPWAPRKADGARALARAPDRISFRAAGNAIVEEAPEHYWLWHQPGTKKMVARPSFPASGSLPVRWVEGAEKALLAGAEGILNAFGP